MVGWDVWPERMAQGGQRWKQSGCLKIKIYVRRQHAVAGVAGAGLLSKADTCRPEDLPCSDCRLVRVVISATMVVQYGALLPLHS
jgi:hypothetical protein